MLTTQLTMPPESFGQLTALQELTLQQSQLIALPETFGQLAALQESTLQQNQLTRCRRASASLRPGRRGISGVTS